MLLLFRFDASPALLDPALPLCHAAIDIGSGKQMDHLAAALIVAAGRGERAGGALPKQFRALLGIPVLRRSVEAFAAHRDISIVVVVAPSDRLETASRMLAGTRARVVPGGATRQESVRLGLNELKAYSVDFVLIHDAARPLVSPAVIDRVLAALKSGSDGAVPMLPVSDTLKRRDDDAWTTVSRNGLLRAQTPQGFRFSAIAAAHKRFEPETVTDDMALAEMAGMKIEGISGEELNVKITGPDDLVHAQRLIAGSMGEYRTGMGFDAHRFGPGDHVWLCGVKIAHDHALLGHSDADVGLHALTDAILGAIGEGDIGQHFPPTDEQWRGALSHTFLEHALALVHKKGRAFVHCDITLICESPKIAPYREAMRARLAEIIEVDVSRVSVKATTTEGMGFTGRREGLVAQAIATLRVPFA